MTGTLCHKLLDGFALGVPIQRAELHHILSGLLLCFASLTSPLGVLVGVALISPTREEGALLARALCLSLSCGSFLFIALFELLPKSLAPPRRLHIVKLCLTFIGYLLMSVLAIFQKP